MKVDLARSSEPNLCTVSFILMVSRILSELYFVLMLLNQYKVPTFSPKKNCPAHSTLKLDATTRYSSSRQKKPNKIDPIPADRKDPTREGERLHQQAPNLTTSRPVHGPPHCAASKQATTDKVVGRRSSGGRTEEEGWEG